jgi:hypothetical protein
MSTTLRPANTIRADGVRYTRRELELLVADPRAAAIVTAQHRLNVALRLARRRRWHLARVLEQR